MLNAGLLPGLLLNPENGGDMLIFDSLHGITFHKIKSHPLRSNKYNVMKTLAVGGGERSASRPGTHYVGD